MKRENLVSLIGSILICQAVGVLGTVATVSSITGWYGLLNKPFFTPPSYIFGPVWFVLYCLMGISLYLVWQKKKASCEEGVCYFWAQLALNCLWTFIFFGAKNLWFSFLVIVFLWVMIFLTILKFRKISIKASWLLVPYQIWVSFAALLNFSVALLN